MCEYCENGKEITNELLANSNIRKLKYKELH